jgi:hypothetical protein
MSRRLKQKLLARVRTRVHTQLMNTTAKTIADQIGRRAFIMIGAKDLLDCGDTLQFKVGRNSQGIGAVRVTLTPDDTYTMTFFGALSRKTYEMPVKAEVEGVYADRLRSTIERHTGLYTSL